MKPKEEMDNLLQKLPKEVCVSFALYCAKDVFHLVTPEHKELAQRCLTLTERWLTHGDVTREELNDAASVTYAASSAYYASTAASAYASSATYTAYHTAHAATSSTATAAASAYASSATYTAYHTAHAATSSTATAAAYRAASATSYASAAYRAAYAASKDKLKEYLLVLKDMIKNMTKLEKIIYNMELK